MAVAKPDLRPNATDAAGLKPSALHSGRVGSGGIVSDRLMLIRHEVGLPKRTGWAGLRDARFARLRRPEALAEGEMFAWSDSLAAGRHSKRRNRLR